MNQQNLNLYHIFHETAVCGSLSNAAKRLYISQPAISKAISKLESNLSATLFIRNSRGVKLTPEGELLFKQIDTAFHAIRQGEEQLWQNHELGVGQLSIGVSTTLCKYRLLPYLQRYIRENPHVTLSIYCQSSLDTIEGLENGKLDVGLIGESEHMGSLSFLPLEEIQDMFVTTTAYMEHLKERTPSGDNDLLSQATLLLLDRNNLTRQYVDKYLLFKDILPKQQLEVTTMDLLIEFAKIGMGVACVIGNFVQKELSDNTLIPFPMSEPIPKRKIGLAFKDKANPNTAMQKFISLTRE